MSSDAPTSTKGRRAGGGTSRGCMKPKTSRWRDVSHVAAEPKPPIPSYSGAIMRAVRDTPKRKGNAFERECVALLQRARHLMAGSPNSGCCTTIGAACKRSW
jgi:hypothetical protein